MPIRVKLTEEAVILTGIASSSAARMWLRSFMSLNINAYRSKTGVWYGCCCIPIINGAAGQYASASGAGYANLSMEVDHAFGKKRRFSIHVFRASLSKLRRR